MKFGDSFKFSSEVATKFVAAKAVRVIAGRGLESFVYSRINARHAEPSEGAALVVPDGLSGAQKARVVVAESVYLSMLGHPLTWVLAAACACYWAVVAVRALV